jgi:3',5'-cyclic AMP phosphodiesterase CpdA
LAWLVCALLSANCSAAPSGSGPPGPQVVAGADQPPQILHPRSLKFAVIGDSGRWSHEQRENAAQLTAQRQAFRFDLVLMLGDNNYGDGSPESYLRRFEEPFKPLLDAGVKFYATRGNHDVGPQWDYALFNMGGRRYYTFERDAGLLPPVAGDRVQFFAVDTVNPDNEQLVWLDRELSASRAGWKIVFQHHPIYTSGRYMLSSAFHRRTLEQAFVEHSVDVVFAGHEHVYERLLPQRGVMYFVSGAAGSVRTGDLRPTAYFASGYDRDLSFMLIEIAGDTLYFRSITRTGQVVDQGSVRKRKPSS